MSGIKEICSKYLNKNIKDLTGNDKDLIYDYLSNVKANEIQSLEDHKKYIELVALLRQANMDDLKRNGENFIKTLQSLLAVGEDGLYANKMRFIYELIQNVDDCEYDDISDCNLDVFFTRGENPAHIIFTYNEKGFTPQNVFAITGIAAAVKNITPGKVEIGEKGIGFKSVFGVAEKVIIQSGKFSFTLNKDNFIVPVPFYEEFEEIKGTRLVLETDEVSANRIYKELANTYVQKDAILNKNPILFLNKLTHLKLYQDGFRTIEFNVERNNPEKINGILVERNVKVSVILKDVNTTYADASHDPKYISSVECIRYTMPLLYGEKECKSRYGDTDLFKERSHNLVALVPVNQEDCMQSGLLYSFLPTKVKTSVPIIIHAPFKLNGSRESVDPQGKNEWFRFTIEHMQEFLKSVYVHLSRIVGNRIYQYLPTRKQDFFDKECGVQALFVNGLKGATFSDEKIFVTTEGVYCSANDVVSLGAEETIRDAKSIHRLLNIGKRLHIPFTDDNTHGLNMNNYGIEVITKTNTKLVMEAFRNEDVTNDIADLLEQIGEDKLYNVISGLNYIYTLSPKQVDAIATHPVFNKTFLKISKNDLHHGKPVSNKLDIKFEPLSQKTRAILDECKKGANIDARINKYLQKIFNKIYVVDSQEYGFYFVSSNGLVVNKNNPLVSFGNFCDQFDPRRTFASSLSIRELTLDLDSESTEKLSDESYLRLLHDVRSSLINAYGMGFYEKFIKIVNTATGDNNRFFSELLQNADDCMYPNGVIPTFKAYLTGNMLTVAYNETGFTKANVRAITDIGESTKKRIDQGDFIGEKGIGFKSVFNVAQKVIIHSNGFNFSLTAEKPTVPEPVEGGRYTEGTIMNFTMKAPKFNVLSSLEIVKQCLCLKKLKSVSFGSSKIEIEDNYNQRVIRFDNKNLIFEKFVYQFDINDQQALEEREDGRKKISAHQIITLYLPLDFNPGHFYMYAGLPTDIECNIPLIIDAPFELTSARNDVLRNRWNNIIKKNVYQAILEFMDSKKASLRLDVLKFVGFSYKDNIGQLKTFSNDYLNPSDWLQTLKGEKIIPCLLKESEFTVPGQQCLIVPDIVAELLVEEDTISSKYRTTVDTRDNKNFNSLLQLLGCKFDSHEASIDFISSHVNKIVYNERLRNNLYTYLSSPQFANIKSEQVAAKVAKLPIYPIRVKQSGLAGTEYISWIKDKIYTHATNFSDSDLKILDTDIMPLDMADKILGKNYRIPPLTQYVYDKLYQDRIEKLILSGTSAKNIAEYLLEQYRTNLVSLKNCQNTLKGLRESIPLKTASGNYRRGGVFYSFDDINVTGELLNEILIDKAWEGLGKLIGIDEIENIQYNHIAQLDIESLSDEDIEDLNDIDLNYKYDILINLINDELITEEQIAMFELEYFAGRSTVETGIDAENFPEDKVANIAVIKNNVKSLFKKPNIYQCVQVPKWVSDYPLKKIDNAKYNYGSKNQNQCFCQMCRKKYNYKYVERVELRMEPRFAWDQMFLNLCLTCAKDYKSIYRNKSIMHKFIYDLKQINLINSGKQDVAIPDTNANLTFTSSHLAYIKEILAIEESYTEKTPRDIMKEKKDNKNDCI